MSQKQSDVYYPPWDGSKTAMRKKLDVKARLHIHCAQMGWGGREILVASDTCCAKCCCAARCCATDSKLRCADLQCTGRNTCVFTGAL